MMRVALWAAALLLALNDSWAGGEGWVPVKIEQVKVKVTENYSLRWGSAITFRNGSTLRFGVVEMVYVGQLPAATKAPFLIFSGRICDECDANTNLFIHSPADGFLSAEGARYGYPGKVYHYEDNTLLEESRVFFGVCLPGRGPAAVWYMKVLLESGKWQDAVYVAEVRGDVLKKGHLKAPLPHIRKTLALVKDGSCREIPGVRMTSEP